ncbi:type II toxin-antitoxin system YafQ family toxin [Polynucleobacter paneuropaeus]|uniref:type II toxin-antitoxin system YafQ family toxin n=1 Tax=Polynucleobacter TaxID=44013 RepID=UPI001BFD9C76|nr:MULTISPECIES: type II toxin-antitoxin system YafQ family toxin [Polynucleobacter]MBT8515908.1 type II toxin-antitoxin system YafQ family toxin [Polynucleobacter paneuropaeus]MBT8519639.1 type II toxin-antitoxin system YafQ family toxin [Polynucleobacter paneuropaeus]MBT8529649.1 type II toxin-antitoxin system YafQ family toxin [Polynucleobacter paneuropaeus]MBT8543640.1 type II toxin-antitoxin system YafQ family toxin [Polynucleobacter paneuropaeus]MBT8554144.1 type II toxin-antitoxin syste
MRTTEYTKKFRKDYKRELKGRYRLTLARDFQETLDYLINDWDLPYRYHDHPLAGDWVDHRDCHIKPDLVLIYRKPDQRILQLVRLGSHSELSL